MNDKVHQIKSILLFFPFFVLYEDPVDRLELMLSQGRAAALHNVLSSR